MLRHWPTRQTQHGNRGKAGDIRPRRVGGRYQSLHNPAGRPSGRRLPGTDAAQAAKGPRGEQHNTAQQPARCCANQPLTEAGHPAIHLPDSCLTAGQSAARPPNCRFLLSSATFRYLPPPPVGLTQWPGVRPAWVTPVPYSQLPPPPPQLRMLCHALDGG